MKDLDKILSRLGELERQVRNARRPATISQVGKDDRVGQYKLNLGKKSDGSVWESPWLKAGNHQGVINENVPFEKGQNVWVNQHGGDFHHAEITPYTDSQYDPMPKDAKPNKHTYRVRKPPEEDQSQSQSGGAGGGAGGAQSSGQSGGKAGQEKEREKQKDDDENDFIFRSDYEGRYVRKKKASYLFGQPEKQQDQQGQQGQQGGAQAGTQAAAAGGQSGQSKDPEGDKERHQFKCGSSELLMVDGKIVFKVGKSTYTMTDGSIVQTAGTQSWKWTSERTDVSGGGVIAHDKQGIGKGHHHKDVEKGGDETGDPAEQ